MWPFAFKPWSVCLSATTIAPAKIQTMDASKLVGRHRISTFLGAEQPGLKAEINILAHDTSRLERTQAAFLLVATTMNMSCFWADKVQFIGRT